LWLGQFNNYLSGYAQQYDASGLIGAICDTVDTTQVTNNSPSDSKKSVFSTGVVVGIAVGGFLVLVIIGLLVWYCCKPRGSKQQQQTAHLVAVEGSSNPLSANDKDSFLRVL
jgi:hypothetical protein